MTKLATGPIYESNDGKQISKDKRFIDEYDLKEKLDLLGIKYDDVTIHQLMDYAQWFYEFFGSIVHGEEIDFTGNISRRFHEST